MNGGRRGRVNEQRMRLPIKTDLMKLRFHPVIKPAENEVYPFEKEGSFVSQYIFTGQVICGWRSGIKRDFTK